MRLAIGLFAGVFVLFAARQGLLGREQATLDTFGTRLVPVSLLREGNLDLDEYVKRRPGEPLPYCVVTAGGRVYSRFPVGGPLLLVPVYAAAASVGLDVLGNEMTREKLCGYVAAGLSSLAVLLVYLAFAHRGPIRALVAALALGVGSAVLPLCNQELWQHTFGIVFVAWAVLLLERGTDDPYWFGWLGLPCGLLFLVRPTNAVLIAVLGLFVLWRSPRQFGRFLLMGLPFLAVGLGHNLLIFGSLSGGYANEASALRLANVWSGSLTGILFSPSRGLFVYSPWVALALLASRRAPVYALLLAAQVALFGTYGCWYGGHCYGPRMLLEVMPACAALLWHALPVAWIGRALAAALLGWSVVAAGAGYVIHWSAWCGHPDIDRCPGRLWDWRDSPFLVPFIGLPPRCAHPFLPGDDFATADGVGVAFGAGWSLYPTRGKPLALGEEAKRGIL